MSGSVTTTSPTMTFSWHESCQYRSDKDVAILAGLSSLLQMVTQMSGALADLQTNVSNNTTVIGSAIELLQGLKAKLDAAGTDPAALKALSDELGAQDQALAAAVTANTPAA